MLLPAFNLGVRVGQSLGEFTYSCPCNRRKNLTIFLEGSAHLFVCAVMLCLPA